MLSNIFLVIAMLINGIVIFLAYRTGLKDGLRVREGKSISNIVNLPAKPVPISEAQRKLNTLMENVNNYTGTSKGQKEVK